MYIKNYKKFWLEYWKPQRVLFCCFDTLFDVNSYIYVLNTSHAKLTYFKLTYFEAMLSQTFIHDSSEK